MNKIKLHGARVHNLKNIDLEIPKHKLVVITGISGSGKSSLAFDILFEEGKNQYLQSIGILAGLDNDDKFDTLEGIGPAVAVRQNTIRQSNPRSTVGSKTAILNQLALLYASDGTNMKSIACNGTNTRSIACDGTNIEPIACDGTNIEPIACDGTNIGPIACDEWSSTYDDSINQKHLSPSEFLYTTADGMCIRCQGRGSYYDIDLKQLVTNRMATLSEVYEDLKITSGFMRILRKRYGEYFDIPFWQLPENIMDEVVYGTYDNGKQSYCLERVLRNAFEKGEDVDKVYVKTICPECQGERICDDARRFFIHGKGIGELGQMTLTALLDFLSEISDSELSQFGKNVVKNIKKKLSHLILFRLGHLSLYREMSSLSGGEVQRIYLHQHLESGLDSLIYIFDEPMSGLHASEKQSMIEAVKELRDLGNTVIVVEHDRDMIKQADHIIEIGPKAGVNGGEVVYQGDYIGYLSANTLLSQYISGKCRMPERNISKQEIKIETNNGDCLYIEHANIHYLKDISVAIPLHAMVGIAGLSGSGKSSLIEDTLIKRLISAKKHGYAGGLSGIEHISGFAEISQEPIGRSSSSTPASYIGIWDKIREIFAKQPEAIANNMDAGYFSFHSKGACPDCGGSGYERIYLTSDFSVDKQCKTCQGKRFCEDSLAIKYKGKNIADVLEMSITEAALFFADHQTIVKPLRVLEQMGMGYLTLGQPTSSLSGGEAQRVKLTKELGQQHKCNMLYILDEPTTGLSMYDIAMLLRLLDQLIASGNSVIVIEHNIEVLKCCDYIIELGPEGGDKGGELIATGTPEQLKNNLNSKTGRYLV